MGLANILTLSSCPVAETRIVQQFCSIEPTTATILGQTFVIRIMPPIVTLSFHNYIKMPATRQSKCRHVAFLINYSDLRALDIFRLTIMSEDAQW